MSLLLSEGHNQARAYPLGMLRTEADLVRSRLADRMGTEAVLLHSAIVAVLAGKPAVLNDAIGKLDGQKE